MKKANDYFSIFMVIVVAIAFFSIFKSCKQKIRYQMQTIGVSQKDFKKTWGTPDYEILNKPDIILFYKSDVISGHNYVFKFDYKTKILKAKFYDD